MMVFSSVPSLTSYNNRPAAPNINTEFDGMHGGLRQRKAGYKRDFDIQRTRIPTNKEITDSMLSYSNRMTDVNRHRGFRLEDDIELPLLIKATHLPHPSKLNRSQEKRRRNKSKILTGGAAVRTKSLPNMKLEPLLGNKQQYKISAASMVDLKNIMTVRHKPHALYPLHTSRVDAYVDDKTEDNSTNDSEAETNIKVVVNTTGSLTDRDTQTIDSISSAQTENKYVGSIENIPDHLKLPPVNQTTTTRRLGKPRKSKRMKLHKSKLESIEEDEDNEVLTRFSGSGHSSHRLSLSKSYSNPGGTLLDYNNYQDIHMSMEERRKDVALLRKLSNSSNTAKHASQLSIQTLAKKKLRKLPAISSDALGTE